MCCRSSFNAAGLSENRGSQRARWWHLPLGVTVHVWPVVGQQLWALGAPGLLPAPHRYVLPSCRRGASVGQDSSTMRPCPLFFGEQRNPGAPRGSGAHYQLGTRRERLPRQGLSRRRRLLCPGGSAASCVPRSGAGPAPLPVRLLSDLRLPFRAGRTAQWCSPRELTLVTLPSSPHHARRFRREFPRIDRP